MQAQVSCEIRVFSVPVKVKAITTFSTIKEKTTINYFELKNRICKDTFHIGC